VCDCDHRRMVESKSDRIGAHDGVMVDGEGLKNSGSKWRKTAQTPMEGNGAKSNATNHAHVGGTQTQTHTQSERGSKQRMNTHGYSAS
jgi:hypothetical protein